MLTCPTQPRRHATPIITAHPTSKRSTVFLSWAKYRPAIDFFITPCFGPSLLWGSRYLLLVEFYRSICCDFYSPRFLTRRTSQRSSDIQLRFTHAARQALHSVAMKYYHWALPLPPPSPLHSPLALALFSRRRLITVTTPFSASSISLALKTSPWLTP